jgi:putative Mg2+ transporter-C (MgtC) family protein
MSISELLAIYPYSWSSIGTAVFCGGLIGLERQLRGKPVGMRTAALIILGTYLFLATSFMLQSQIIDPSRIIGQVVTGIGFLGAGVMLARDGRVAGVTSAACIWVLASIGVVIATDHLEQAIKLSVLVVCILYGLDFLEDRFKILGRGVHARVHLSFQRSRSKAERPNGES